MAVCSTVYQREGMARGSQGIRNRFGRTFGSTRLLIARTTAERVAELYKSGPYAAVDSSIRGVEFVEISVEDEREIEEITSLDPWKIPKDSTVRMLSEGHKLFAAKFDGRVVASSTACVGPSWYDEYLRRTFTLSADEAYHSRCFSVAELRGKGLMVGLLAFSILIAAKRYSRPVATLFVRTNNDSMIHTIAKVGFETAGYCGYVDFFDMRLHYLFGHCLPSTKKGLMFRDSNSRTA